MLDEVSARRKASGLRVSCAGHIIELAIGLVAFAIYGYYRVRYVGGCDAWAYVSHGRLLRGHDVGLATTFDPVRYPAVVPLCYELAGKHFVPGMPPGYGVELALGGLVGGEFFVSPLVGAACAVLAYRFARESGDRTIALGLTALWITSPIVIWGGISLMSDLSAAVGLWLSHALAASESSRAGGLVLGASVGIRPTNLLFFPSGVITVPKNRVPVFALGLSVGLLGWFWFGLRRYGGLAVFPMYGSNIEGITYERFGAQLWFYATTTCRMFPLLVPLAVVNVVRSPRASLPLVLWLAAFVLFYAGWRWPYDAWWWTRHILPGYPALALLAFRGMGLLRAAFAPARTKLFACATAVLVAANVVANLEFAESHGLFSRKLEYHYQVNSAIVRRSVAANSLVGGLNFSGALRYYAGLETFRWDHVKAPDVIDAALDRGRPVYVVIEPDLFETHPQAVALRTRYRLRAVKKLRQGYVLRTVERRR